MKQLVLGVVTLAGVVLSQVTAANSLATSQECRNAASISAAASAVKVALPAAASRRRIRPLPNDTLSVSANTAQHRTRSALLLGLTLALNPNASTTRITRLKSASYNRTQN